MPFSCPVLALFGRVSVALYCKNPGNHAGAADERGNPGSFITFVPGYELIAGFCSLEAQPKWMRVP